jgi:hypothetical protein
MVHMRIFGALLAFALIAQCRDPSPAPPQPTPDPGPGTIFEAEHAAPSRDDPEFKEVRL